MLLKRDHRVVLFDALDWGMKPILHFATHPNVTIVRGDIRDREAVTPLVREAEVVMHLAAIVGYPACAADPVRARSVNVDGTRNVVESLDGQKLIFASTGSTYGKVDGICTEETAIAPLTLYGSTKWESEKVVTATESVALRFATVFGISPRLRLDLLVNDFVHQALHNKQIILYEGQFRRTFLHVADAARSYLFALDHYDRLAGQPVNVGDESMNYTKRDIATLIGEYVDYYLHEADVGEDQDKRNYEVSYEKIRNLGFETTITLRQGIEELIKVLAHIKITNEWRNI